MCKSTSSASTHNENDAARAAPQKQSRVWSRPNRRWRQHAKSINVSLGQRETVGQSIRVMGHAYHFVDLDRGVRRNGKLIASDIPAQIDTLRTIAQQEGLRETCLARIEKAERVVPKLQATIAFVSGYVRRPGASTGLGAARSPTPCTPISCHPSILRAWPRRGRRTEGAPLRVLAERLRTPLFEPGGALDASSLMEQTPAQA